MKPVRAADDMDRGEQYIAMDPVGIFDESLVFILAMFALPFLCDLALTQALIGGEIAGTELI